MKERPILFSAPMVRAILAGTKTQTRREAKGLIGLTGAVRLVKSSADGFPVCPYGQPGDRLWVREAFRFPESLDGISPRAVAEKSIAAGYHAPWCPTQYEADGARQHAQEWRDFVTPPMPNEPGRLRASLHMPRWASRITLEITSIRVERLQDISEADAIAEGVRPESHVIPDDDTSAFFRIGAVRNNSYPIARYAALWESLNGAGSWAANPWVWAVEFKRVEGGAA